MLSVCGNLMWTYYAKYYLYMLCYCEMCAMLYEACSLSCVAFFKKCDLLWGWWLEVGNPWLWTLGYSPFTKCCVETLWLCIVLGKCEIISLWDVCYVIWGLHFILGECFLSCDIMWLCGCVQGVLGIFTLKRLAIVFAAPFRWTVLICCVDCCSFFCCG